MERQALISGVMAAGFIVLGWALSLDVRAEDRPEVFVQFRETGEIGYVVSTPEGQHVLSGNSELGVTRIDEVEPKMPAEPPPSVDDVPRLTTPKRQSGYAIVVGIEHYRDLPHAKYARRDAEVMREYLIHAMGFREENVRLLLDEQATHLDIKCCIEEWLPMSVLNESLIWFFYSGHGVIHPERCEAYLLPYDGDPNPNFLDISSYSLSHLLEQLVELPVRGVVVVLDASFGGQLRYPPRERERCTNPFRKLPSSKRLAVVVAAEYGQNAGLNDNQRHGLLTLHLLDALRGAADMDGDRWVTLKEVFLYVKEAVRRSALQENWLQEPHILPASDRLDDMGTLRLTRLPEAP